MSSHRSSVISAVIGLLSVSALAAPVWTTGSTTGSGGFTPAADNLIAGLVPISASNGSAGVEGTGGAERLTDGRYGSSNGERYAIGNYASLTYTLPGGLPYSIEGVNLYSQWNDDGRDRITISSIDVLGVDGVWSAIADSSVNYDDDSFNCFAKLADSTPGGILAIGTAIRVNFGEQENGYVGYLELEVVGRTAGILELRNPLTGSTEATCTNAVEVSRMPIILSATQYQITVGGADPAADGWLAYTPGMVPAGAIDFATPAADGDVTFTAWFRVDAEDDAPVSFNGSIYYTSAGPSLVVRDITLMLGKNGTRTIDSLAIDAGSSDPYGILSLTISPATFTTVGVTPVTVTAVNAAGNVSTATADVTTIPFQESGIGTGENAEPLPHSYFLRLLHLGANFNDEWIDSPGTGGVDADQLANFGGQAHQNPSAGLKYEGVFGANTFDGSLTWTLMDCPDPSGRWTPTPDRSDYIKYWHIYINLPGKEERTVYFRHYNDDGLRVWNNGTLMVSHGGSGGEYVTEGKLFPGLNSITIKLQEGGGGDYMQLRITDADGNYFDDLTYQFSPVSFSLVDPVSGSPDYTSSTTLSVVGLPSIDQSAIYQFTTSEDPASLSPAWNFYDYLNPPTSVTFPQPAAPGVVTNVLWIRRVKDGETVTEKFADTISYSVEAPTAAAKDIDVAIDSVEGTLITPEMIDDGSVGGESGICSMIVTPSRVTAPGVVTLTVLNNAGLTDSATATVGSTGWADVFVSGTGNDDQGTGRPEAPYRSITRALLDANAFAGTVYVDAGTYSEDNGETFPLALANGVRIVGWDSDGEPDRADRVVDGANTAANLFAFADGVSGCVIRGLHLCDTTGALVAIDTTEATFEDILFTQSVGNSNVPGAIQISGDGTANAVDCDFLDMARVAAVWCCQDDNANFHASNCLFKGNTVTYSAIAAPSGARFHVTVDDSDFIENSSSNQKLHDGQASACVYFWGDSKRRGSARLDHCRFLGNSGRGLIGASHADIVVRDSLIVDNAITHHIFNGYSGNFMIDNCTIIRSGGGFNGYVTDTYLRNTILYDTGVITHSSSDMNDDATKLRLQKVVLWETSVGNGYNELASNDVITGNPWLVNADVAWDDPAFDATLRPYSPAIDAGMNAIAINDVDLAGNARIADNDEDDEAVVDLGCYESLFHASPTPVFQIPAPGSLHIFRGGTFTTQVSISPAVDGPVTAAIEYGEGLTGPASITIANGVGPVDLTVGVDAGCVDDIVSFVISESGTSKGVGAAVVDVFPSSNVVTLGGVTKLFLRSDVTRDFAVSFKEEGIVAAEQLAIVVNGPFGGGSNLAEWIGNDYIGVGEHASSGRLEVTGGIGVNTIEVTIGGGFIFDETGTDTVILTVIGHPGYLYVDPEDGLDTATGTLDDPLRTVTYAISELAVGDAVRMLPGEYNTAQETFPLELSGVSLVGCTADGEPVADPEECVVTGGATVDTLVSVSGSDAVTLANLAFRESRAVAVFIDTAPVTVTNAVFTQTVVNKDKNAAIAGAMQQRNNANVTALDCVFTNMTRFAAVYLSKYAANNQQVFTAKRCLFADNDSECGTIASVDGVNVYITLEDCVFRGNAVTQSNSQYSDSFRGQAIFARSGTSLNIRRCQFLGGREGAVLGVNYFNGDDKNPGNFTIDDSLFAGNTAPAGVFHGYSNHPHIRNCTFVGNTGGYNGRYTFPDFYNCIICDGTLSFTPPDGTTHIDEGKGLYLKDTILWNVQEGRGYETNSSVNVILEDPQLKNATVAWDNPAFDAHLRSTSPAIDAGDNAHGYSALDLDGNMRLQIGFAGADEAIIDLGCYESATVSRGTLFMIR